MLVVVQLGLQGGAIVAVSLEVLPVEALPPFAVGVCQEVLPLTVHPNVLEEVEVSVTDSPMLENTGPPLLNVIDMVVVTVTGDTLIVLQGIIGAQEGHLYDTEEEEAGQEVLVSREVLPIVAVAILGVRFVVVLQVILPDIVHLLVPRSGCHLVEAGAGVHQSQDPPEAPHLQKELAGISLGLGHHLAVHQGRRA